MSRASPLEIPVIVVELGEVAQGFWIWALRVQERIISPGKSELQMLEENDDLEASEGITRSLSKGLQPRSIAISGRSNRRGKRIGFLQIVAPTCHPP